MKDLFRYHLSFHSYPLQQSWHSIPSQFSFPLSFATVLGMGAQLANDSVKLAELLDALNHHVLSFIMQIIELSNLSFVIIFIM